MNQETRIALLLLTELVAALRANDPDTFKRWLYGDVQDLGKPAVTELMTDWMPPLLSQEDKGRLVGWHLGGEYLVSKNLWREFNVVQDPSANTLSLHNERDCCGFILRIPGFNFKCVHPRVSPRLI